VDGRDERRWVLGAAGLPLVLVETVGVGQIEVEVAGATDTTVVVVNPGWGDAIQANKAGLLEIADVFVINKADRPGADETRRDLENMLDMSMTMGEWRAPILPAVAVNGDGVPEVWAAVGEHRAYLERSGGLAGGRERRLVDELREVLIRRLERDVDQLAGGDAYQRVCQQVLEKAIDPYGAAEELLKGLRS